MKSITLKLNNGRIQRPEFSSIKTGRDLQERSEKMEMFESLQSDLKGLKDAADYFHSLDGVDREASSKTEVTYHKREGALAQLFLGSERFEKRVDIPAVKDQDPIPGVVLSETNGENVQAYLHYSAEDFDSKQDDALALPTGIKTIVRNWDVPKTRNGLLAKNQWTDRISSEQSEDGSLERYQFSDERAISVDTVKGEYHNTTHKTLAADQRTLEINKETGTVTYTIDPDVSRRDINYSYSTYTPPIIF